MSWYHYYYCFHYHLYQFLNPFCLVFFFYYYYFVFFFFFLLLIKQLLFSHEAIKISRLLCLFISLFCFLSWSCRVIIHNLITLQFSSFIAILTWFYNSFWILLCHLFYYEIIVIDFMALQRDSNPQPLSL